MVEPPLALCNPKTAENAGGGRRKTAIRAAMRRMTNSSFLDSTKGGGQVATGSWRRDGGAAVAGFLGRVAPAGEGEPPVPDDTLTNFSPTHWTSTCRFRNDADAKGGPNLCTPFLCNACLHDGRY